MSNNTDRISPRRLRKSKDELFENFLLVCHRVLPNVERFFGVKDVQAQACGLQPEEVATLDSGGSDELNARARDNLRRSEAWTCLVNLYDFAVDGIQRDSSIDLVCSGADVVHLLTSESHSIDAQWHELIDMADARVALEMGTVLSVSRVALLANVDVRTVRNAISAGDLIASKQDGDVYVDGAAALAWLLQRKGFKPTLRPELEAKSLDELYCAPQLGDFLIERRRQLGMELEKGRVTVLHPSVDIKSLAALESGVFTMPLDAVFPVADFYQLDRKQFLSTVMRLHFADQLQALHEMIVSGEGK